MSKAQQQQSWNSAKTLGQDATNATTPVAATAGTNSSTALGSANKDLGTASDAFTNEAQTGGFTPAQQTGYLDRAASTADAAGNVEENQAQLAAAKTGQGNPQAAISRIARQVNQQKSQNVNDAQADLNTQMNANKLAGAGGAASVGSTEANESNQSAQQQLAALGLQFNTEAEAQQYLNQIANAQKGPLANAEQIYSTAIGNS